jgi:hypothetical protein
MEYIVKEIEPNAKIIDASDLHWDAFNCHRRGVRQMVQRVMDLNAAGTPTYLNLKGDLIEAIIPGDKRYNSLIHDTKFPTPKQSADALIKELAPIAEYILAIGIGNHEMKLLNVMDFSRYMAEQLNVPYGGYTYITDFRGANGKTMFKTFSSHGSGRLPKGAKDPIQREGNRKAHLKRKLEATGVTDCVYMSIGHTHQLLVVEPTFLLQNVLTSSIHGVRSHDKPKTRQNAKYIPADQRWVANTGGFLKLYTPPGLGLTSYAEMALMEPTDLGWVEVDVVGCEVVDVTACKL